MDSMLKWWAVLSAALAALTGVGSYLVKKTHRIERFAEQVPGLRLLTPHERAILRLIARDQSSKEIAREMGIARKTVDAHRSNICRKLEIGGQHALTRFAARHGHEL